NGLLEQQGGPTRAQDAVADLGHFKIGGHGMRQPFEFASLFKLGDKVSEVAVFHRIRPVRLHLHNDGRLTSTFRILLGRGSMAVISSDSLAGRSALSVTRQVSEFIYVCAIYLGIAVLITVVFGATVPSLRGQVAQVHEALVMALRPAGEFRQGWFASYDGDVPPEDARAARLAEAATRPPDASALSFSQALKTSTEGRHASGLTAAQAQALRSYLARKYRIAHSVA